VRVCVLQLEVIRVIVETYRFLGQKVCLQFRHGSNLTNFGLVDSLDTAHKYQGGR
jgi:hypothetical protein